MTDDSGRSDTKAATQSGSSCACCGQPVPREEVAAAVFIGALGLRKVWCFPCWDSDDELALRQYQEAGRARPRATAGYDQSVTLNREEIGKIMHLVDPERELPQ